MSVRRRGKIVDLRLQIVDVGCEMWDVGLRNIGIQEDRGHSSKSLGRLGHGA